MREAMYKRACITGGSGMVGRNLLEHPRASDWDVIAPDRATLDLTDREAVKQFLSECRPDIVIHAAGQVGGIQANMKDPVGFLINNLDIGRNVIMSAFEVGVPSLINLSSSCMYPRGRECPLRESDILTGELEPTNEGYALSKIISTKLCEYISRSCPTLAYRTIVPCNLYGRYDTFDPQTSHLVPAIIAKISSALADGNTRVDIWGDGTARREFMYAGDAADAIWLAACMPESLPPIVNIGVGQDHSILDYYQIVADVIGWSGQFQFDLSRPVGMHRKLSDISLQKHWGWTASTPLREGIFKTIQFYQRQV